MSAWHDRVGDLTLFEALTGGAFDRLTGNIAGNLTKNFQKSPMPGGLPGGGMDGFGIDRYITNSSHSHIPPSLGLRFASATISCPLCTHCIML